MTNPTSEVVFKVRFKSKRQQAINQMLISKQAVYILRLTPYFHSTIQTSSLQIAAPMKSAKAATWTSQRDPKLSYLLPFDALVADCDGEDEVAETAPELSAVFVVFDISEPVVDVLVVVLLLELRDEEDMARTLLVEVETEVEVGVSVVVWAVVTDMEVETAVEATTVEVLRGRPPGWSSKASCVGEEIVSFPTQVLPNNPTRFGAQQK